MSGLLPDTNEQFVFHFFPNLHLSRLCFEVGNGKGRRVEGGGLGRWGGHRLCDTVFVFKGFRLAYKCAGAHTFKVKQINLPETLFMAIMRRIFEERCKIVEDHEAKGTQIEVCQGVDDIFRCKVTSLQNIREVRLNADIQSLCMFALYSSPQLVIFNKCHIFQSATDLFFISGSKRLIAVVQTETSFSDSTQTNHKGVKKDRKTEKKNGKSSSVVHLADDILCSLSVISFSSVKMDRISSCVALPPQDDCSTEVPGDTFFPSVSLNVLSVLFSPNFMN